MQKRGFTLLEVILSIALLTLISSFSFPIYQSLQVKNDTEISATTIVHTMRRAQLLAQAGEADTAWGVFIAPGQGTLFAGESFLSRDESYDDIVAIPTSIEPGGIQEIIFSKLTGAPHATGTITLANSVGDVRNIHINSKGIISY